MAATPSVEIPQYLSFFVAGEEYGVGILKVREILEFDTITRVPGTPPHVRGVLNLRGSVVPVIDLAVKLGLPETQVTRRTCVVIVEVLLEGEPTVMGLMADAVSQVIELSPDQVEPPPPFGTGIRVEFLQGMGRAGKKFVLLLDIERVLTTNELLAVASIAAAGPPAGPPAESSPGGRPEEAGTPAAAAPQAEPGPES